MDSYVVGFLYSFDLEKWLLIDKGFTRSSGGQSLRWSGLGGKIISLQDKLEAAIPTRLQDIKPGEFRAPHIETPHEAMEREFLEESGYKISAKRWYCFFIKEYRNSKIYFFCSACSPDEMNRVIATSKNSKAKESEGELHIHQYIDLCFDPNKYTFDLRYIIPMIMIESQKGMLFELDPEGINSEFKRISG